MNYCNAEHWRRYFKRLLMAGILGETLASALTQALDIYPYEDGNIWAGYSAAILIPCLNGMTARITKLEDSL